MPMVQGRNNKTQEAWVALLTLGRRTTESKMQKEQLTELESHLQGLLANPAGPIQSNSMNGWGFTNCTENDIAELAYVMAEAMLQARKPK